MRSRILAGVWFVCLAALVAMAWAGEPALAQNATRTPTRTPTRSPTVTRTPSPTPTLRGVPPPPVVQIILPAPSVKNQLVGDVVSQPGVPLSANYPTLFGDRIALGMANLRDTSTGPNAGDGIESVEFTILDLNGAEVHHVRTGAADRFCVFGGAGDACALYDFAANDYRWPGGVAVESGRYTLVAFARGDVEDHKGAWTLPFEVRLARDGQQTSDGSARIVSIAREGKDGFTVGVETLGFVSFARSTHLLFHDGALSEEEIAPGAPGVLLVYPGPEQMDRPGAFGLATVTVKAPSGRYRTMTELCVAVVHPDDTVIPGRGDCVPVPRE